LELSTAPEEILPQPPTLELFTEPVEEELSMIWSEELTSIIMKKNGKRRLIYIRDAYYVIIKKRVQALINVNQYPQASKHPLSSGTGK
jgi:ATP-dependent protease HslVU (ClpYQ) ATPase subunit